MLVAKLPAGTTVNPTTLPIAPAPFQDVTNAVDVLIICAMKVEFDEVVKVTDGIIDGWELRDLPGGDSVADAKFSVPGGGELSIRATWAVTMGREQTQALTSRLLSQFPVSCLAMSGICAGRRGKISLGDVVLANQLWSYDAGKNSNGHFEPDPTHHIVEEQWVQRMQQCPKFENANWIKDRPQLTLEAQEDWAVSVFLDGNHPAEHQKFSVECPDWSSVRVRLVQKNLIQEPSEFANFLNDLFWRRTGDRATLTRLGKQYASNLKTKFGSSGRPSDPSFNVHAAPMGTGAVVQEDEDLFSQLVEFATRKVMAVDMEASGLARSADAHKVPCIVSKGVQDFADKYKDDRYRHFASRAAAECLIWVLRRGANLLTRRSREHQAIERTAANVLSGESASAGQQASFVPVVVPPQEAVDRLVQMNLDQFRRRRTFNESSIKDLTEFAERVDSGDLTIARASLKVGLFKDAAAMLARSNELEQARTWLSKAKSADYSADFRTDEARLLIVSKNYEAALNILEAIDTDEARSLYIEAIAGAKGLDAATQFATSEHILPGRVTGAGLLSYALRAINQMRYDLAESALAGASQGQIDECPAILSVRATARIIVCRPKHEWPQLPVASAPLHPNAVKFSDEPVKIQLRLGALEDLQLFLTKYAPTLNVPGHSEYLSDCQLWLRLTHPDASQRATATEWLKEEVKDVAKAVRWARFAFDYGVDVDKTAMSEHLNVRKLVGKWSHDEMVAALLLALRSDDYPRLDAFIQDDRVALEDLIGPIALAQMEVEVSARIGQVARAEKIIADLRPTLSRAEISKLENLILEIQGGDALILRREIFEKSPGSPERRLLVMELLDKGKNAEAIEHLTILFGENPAISDALMIAQRLLNESNFAGLRTFLVRSDVQSLMPSSLGLQGFEAWSAYYSGDLRSALQKLMVLREAGGGLDHNGRQLLINLLTEKGDWEQLNPFLAEELEKKESVEKLLGAADLGRISGLPQAQIEALIDAAAELAMQSQQNAASYLGAAYHAAVNLGMEAESEKTHAWLMKAAELSGEHGPIQRRPIKDMVDLINKSRESVNFVNDLISSATAPLAIAAQPLNTTLTEIVLGNLVSNGASQDPRRRAGLPLFSGNRIPRTIDPLKSIALDRSSLMVLEYLGLFEDVLTSFDRVVLGRQALNEFLHDLTKVRFHQPSRIEKARKLAKLIVTGVLHVVEGTAADAEIDALKVGGPLARLLAAARAVGGVVVVSPPIYEIGSLMEVEVDVTSISDLICSPHDVLDYLENTSELGHGDVQAAKDKMLVSPEHWLKHAALVNGKPLFLENVAAEAFVRSNLPDVLSKVFRSVSVDVSLRDDVGALISYAEYAQSVEDHVHRIRKLVSKSVNDGKVKIAPRAPPQESNKLIGDGLKNIASLESLLANFGEVDAVVIDDRALNKVDFLADESGSRIPILTTLNLLQILKDKRVLTIERYEAALTKLRRAGALFMPIDRAQLTDAAIEKGAASVSSYELRSQADYLDFARFRGMLQLPSEGSWMGQSNLEIVGAIHNVWIKGSPVDKTIAVANQLLNLLLDPLDWIPPDADEALGRWADFHRSSLVMLLGQAPEQLDRERQQKYLEWIELAYIEGVKLARPSTLDMAVATLRAIWTSEIAEEKI